ncbi:3-dehydroquinate synthase [Puniceicoccales bacterium CK1056]|uniref:3-dehydroquinate synthase n=1 Tax=Oceanipulchritudo coccoides TaxID=2706888 RepID=A0A6B2LXT6_9BACT|nr:3-dehydroquinate synthase [Oceanipulchritudo coccoides]
MLESLEVSLAERSYPIHIGRDLGTSLRRCVAADLADGRKLAVITDASVAREQAAFVEHAFGDLPVLVLPSGESTKAFHHLEHCANFLAEVGLDRGGRIFALGGGVIGDLAGFAAASFYRGIGFYQIPTTLLAMVDSSVGGKTGINLTAGKNLVGAFHQPLCVFADLDTLLSLPKREFNAGMAEVIKHGLLADEELFTLLESGPRLEASSEDLPAIIRRNCGIKAGVVSADEREESGQGGRALLNLGHTFGHAIEAVAGYGTYLHGEAIAIGLVLACQFSERLGNIDSATVDRAVPLLQKYDLPVRLRKPLPLDSLLAAVRKDKKSRAGSLRFVALEKIGKAVTVVGIEPGLLEELFVGVGAAQ